MKFDFIEGLNQDEIEQLYSEFIDDENNGDIYFARRSCSYNYVTRSQYCYNWYSVAATMTCLSALAVETFNQNLF